MKIKRVANFLSVFILLALVGIGLFYDNSIGLAQEGSEKIENTLLDQFSSQGNADFVIRFVEQADLTPAYSMDWDARGEFVYNTLRETAANSQANAIYLLEAKGLKYQSFIAGNDLYVWSGTLADANELAALPEVFFIRATETFYIDPVEEVKPFQNITWSGDLLAKNAFTSVVGSVDATTDWGIIDTKADQAWALGARGGGIKVANIDTGVQYTHPALSAQYACSGDPSNPACWYDPSNICAGDNPCDNNGHGTHTMGTMVAKDNPAFTYIAGMAPDATWIACKGCETSSCSTSALLACADWILQPGGSTANRPNIVNNSWGGGGGNSWYQAKVQAWKAAGIFPAFSAGNSTGCGSLGSPGDYQESFGSTAHNSSRVHAYAQGPSAVFGHTPYTKPNITAPGVSVCSTVPTNSWSCGYSGTSMASPHSAGAVAQVWSVCPSLIGQIYPTFELLQDNADAPTPPNPSCGVPPDGEGTYEDGYGYLNALAAVQACLNGTLEGHVYDEEMNPVEGATITAQPGGEFSTTGADGFYSMDLTPGNYDVTASKLNYTPQTVSGVEVQANQTTIQDFSITFLGAWTELDYGAGCPDWTRMDMEYYPGTNLAYIMGGRSGSTYVGTIYSYDPATNTCANTGRTMPEAVANYTIVPLNNGTDDLLCTFGGSTATGFSTAVQCYNPVANTAANVGSLPGLLGAYIPGGATVVDNIVYVFGGFRNTTVPYNIAETWAWDPVANTWTQKGNLSLARGYIQTAVVDSKIYAFGGDTYDGAGLIAQTIAEVFDPATGSWNDSAVANLATASGEGRGFGFDSGAAYDLAGTIVLAGGGIWASDTNAVLSYDVAANTYDETFFDLNYPRRDHAGFFVPGDPGRMFVFGGHSSILGSDIPPYGPPEYYEVPFKPAGIVVTPELLDITLPPNYSETITMTIHNTGTASLNWNIVEVLGSIESQVGQSSLPLTSNPYPMTLSLESLPSTGNTTNVPVIPEDTVGLVLDDGEVDNNIGLNGATSSSQFLWFNRFTPTVASFPFVLSQIQVFFDISTGVNVGDAIDLVVYQDTTGDDPSDATWLATYPETVQSVDGVTWSEYTLPSPLLLAGPGDVLIGVINRFVESGVSPKVYPAALDTEVSQQRSWVAVWTTDPPDPAILPADSLFNTIDYFGFPGNWMIRGSGETATGVPWLSESPTSGVVPAGDSAVVNLTFNTNGLSFGEYQATLIVYSNDPDTPALSIPVNLTVANFQSYLTIVKK